MRVNYTHLLSLFLAILSALLLTYLVSSCSAKFYYDKAVKKGMRCETTTDTIKIRSIDSMIINGEKTYFYTTKDTIIHFNTVYVPKTRWQTRIEYRYKTRVEKRRIKQQAKTDRVKARQSDFNNPIKLIVVVAFMVGLIYLLFKIK